MPVVKFFKRLEFERIFLIFKIPYNHNGDTILHLDRLVQMRFYKLPTKTNTHKNLILFQSNDRDNIYKENIIFNYYYIHFLSKTNPYTVMNNVNTFSLTFNRPLPMYDAKAVRRTSDDTDEHFLIPGNVSFRLLDMLLSIPGYRSFSGWNRHKLTLLHGKGGN